MGEIQIETIKQSEMLKSLLVRILGKINEREIDNRNMIVLLVHRPERREDPIRKETYYSEPSDSELREMLDGIRFGGTSLADMTQFKNISAKKCAVCAGKDFVLQCLMLNDAVSYYGIIRFMLDEIKEKAEYCELVSSTMLDELFRHQNLENRTLLMEKYAQNFLESRGLPTAELLIELSAQKYEGSEGEARIYIDPADAGGVSKVFVLDQMGSEERVLESGKLRTIRKLMEMSKRKALHLLADEKMCITALVEVGQEEAPAANQQYDYLSFNGYMRWSVYIKGKEEICYRQGKYYLNSSASRDTYAMAVDNFNIRCGGRIEGNTMRLIASLADVLKEQRHGTAVILTDDEDETGRLCRMNRGISVDIRHRQSFRTRDGGFDKESLLSVTDIDGALFMDLEGKCRAFGVIVDGIAREKGNPGRGARYNSINNYIRQKPNDNVYIALIFSEDGGLDIVDNFDVSRQKR